MEETYSCELQENVSGTAGDQILFEISASGTVDGQPVSDDDSEAVDVIEDVEANAKDTFASVSYSGSDGSVPWASNWIELPVDGSQAAWGDVRILEDISVPHAEGPYQLFLRDDQVWLRRQVDLAGYSTAEMDFDYRRDNLLPGHRFDIEVSTDGVTFQPLASIDGFTAGTDLSYARWAPPLDLSAFTGSTLWIQFSNLEDLGMGNTNAVYLDNVEIRLESGNSITAALEATPKSVVEPGEVVSFDLQVTNQSPADPATLTGLADDQIGDLDGVGTCSVPQSLSAGSTYGCVYDHLVGGAAGTQVTHTATAEATVAGQMLQDAASDTVTVEAPGLETYGDGLHAVRFDGNDGTLTWSTPWIESSSDGGAAYYGHVRVEEDTLGTGSYALRIRSDGLDVKRQANLSGFAQARLSFDYRRNNLLDGQRAKVEVSTDGASWIELGEIAGPAVDLSYQRADFDLSPWISSGTWIRFSHPAGQGMGNGNMVYFDNIEIQLTEPLDNGAVEEAPGRTAGNLLRNAGFDQGLSFWRLTGFESQSIVPALRDASGRDVQPSAGWGSARVESASGKDRFALSQCVSVQPSDAYGFGGRVLVEARSELEPAMSMVVETFTDEHCEGAVLESTGELLWLGESGGDWRSSFHGRTTVDEKAASARIWLVVNGEGEAGFRVWIDDLSFRRLRTKP